MKKLLYILAMVCMGTPSFAKKVKFSVDMSKEAINNTGVHVMGDFQLLAGFPNGDWQPNTTTLVNEPGTSNYSIIVDIPAFRKYEYKFLNGDQSYEVEFIQEMSRVGYDFNDNRWVYIDSLADDTTLVGPIIFAGNAPAGKKMLRLIVDLKSETAVHAKGVHIMGNFQNWDPASLYIYSFTAKVSEGIVFIDSGATVEYKFVNGVTTAAAETVPSACANASGNRHVVMNYDTVISITCFASCAPCISSGLYTIKNENSLSIYPNPAGAKVHLSISGFANNYTVNVFDIGGRLVQAYDDCKTGNFTIETAAFQPGLYFVKASDNTGKQLTQKLVIE